jgi:penicillin-insensitive murein endopeptidase
MPLEGDGWRFIKAVHERETRYGKTTLVRALQRAAQVVRDRYPQATLTLGNIGFSGGGRIPWSVSHTSGRDADIAFYLIDEHGHDHSPSHLVRVNRRGKATVDGATLTFDPSRNWVLIESLLTDPELQVQWIFVSRPLRALLLDYGASAGASERVLARAAEILHQPSDSAPHADHFHVRIYCDRRDVLEGCVNTGPVREGVRTYQDDLAAHIHQLIDTLSGFDRAAALASCEKLARLGATAARPQLETLLVHDDPEVQRAAFDALSQLPGGVHLGTLERLAETDQAAPELRHRAARALGFAGNQRTVPLLTDLLSSEDSQLASAANDALVYLTNHRLEPTRGTGPRALRLQTAWRTWYEKNRKDIWAQWMREGFERQGIEFRGKMMSKKSIPKLIRATRMAGHIGYNAQRVLNELTGHTADPTVRSGAQAYNHWKSWWRRSHRRFGFRTASI